MKRSSLVVAAGALLASSAHSQGNVTVYGILDTALVHVSNVDAAGNSVTKMPSLTGTLPSRLGLRGMEDLGGGLAAVFTLESGIAPDSGAMGQGNRLFGRQASVGLKGQWGTLTLGRVPNMTYYATLRSDLLGPALFAIGSVDPYIPNARSDNAIAYLGNFDGLLAGATYSFGRDTSSAGGPAATGCAGESAIDHRACKQATALLGYEVKAYGVNVSYDKLQGGSGAANGLTQSANFDRRAMLNGYLMLGGAKVGGGVMQRRLRRLGPHAQQRQRRDRDGCGRYGWPRQGADGRDDGAAAYVLSAGTQAPFLRPCLGSPARSGTVAAARSPRCLVEQRHRADG
jgi:predicted porin